MPKQSEYMEAFFGVELNTKFEDMISELKDAEENLKELSTEIGTLTQNLNPGRVQGTHQGVPGGFLRERPADQGCPDLP